MPQRFSITILIPVVLCLLFIQDVHAKYNVPVVFRVSLTSGYNDNILNYSPRDLLRFENHSEVYPSEITTTDDWENTFRFRLYTDIDLAKRLKFRPYYSYRITLNSVNTVRNLQSHFFLARFSYQYRYYLYLQYFYMPGYYLRIYKDRDLDEYFGCEFDTYRPTVKFRLRFMPVQVEGSLGWEYLYYNKYFTEYDSEAILYGITGSYDLPFGLELSTGYEFKISDNVGFDQSAMSGVTNPEEDSESGDASYEQDTYFFHAGYGLPFKKPWNLTLSLDAEYRLRYYQSGLSITDDPFHSGREDIRVIITPSVDIPVSSDLDFEIKFTYDQRKTDSPEAIVPSIKNFINRTLELTINYRVF